MHHRVDARRVRSTDGVDREPEPASPPIRIEQADQGPGHRCRRLAVEGCGHQRVELGSEQERVGTDQIDELVGQGRDVRRCVGHGVLTWPVRR